MEPNSNIPNTDNTAGADPLAQKRYAARIAMEGESERKRREAEEKAEADKKAREEAAKKAELEKSAAEKKAAEEKIKLEEKTAAEKTAVSSRLKTELEKIKTAKGEIEKLRSFKLDMDNMVRERDISMAKIIAAEEARKRAEGDAGIKPKTTNIAMIILTAILVLSGISIAVYFYGQSQTANIDATTPQKETYKPLFFSDGNKTVDVTGFNKEKLIQEVASDISTENIEPGKVFDIKLERVGITLSSSGLLSILGSNAPGEFVRSLDPKFMLAIVSGEDGQKASTVILKTRSKEQTFAGILKWEAGSLAKDLQKLLNGSDPTEGTVKKKLSDEVIDNQDSRVLTDDAGQKILIYGFLDAETIVIAGNESSFREILKRFRGGQIN